MTTVDLSVRVCNGRLTQIGQSFRKARKAARQAVFQCECGTRKIIDQPAVKDGSTTSCGCVGRAKTILRNQTHKYGLQTEESKVIRGTGANRSGAYRSWKAMHQRCRQVHPHRHWKFYGAKGINVCEEWNDFAVFHAQMGDRPKGFTLDRVDGDKDYCAENCRWVSWRDQNLNKKWEEVPHTVMVEYNGESLCLKQATEKAGLNYVTVHARIRNLGWSVERALTTPVK